MSQNLSSVAVAIGALRVNIYMQKTTSADDIFRCFFSSSRRANVTNVVPTKSESDIILCLQLLSKTLSLEQMRIDRSLVY